MAAASRDHQSVTSGKMLFGRLARRIKDVPFVYWFKSKDVLVQAVKTEAYPRPSMLFPEMARLLACPATTPEVQGAPLTNTCWML